VQSCVYGKFHHAGPSHRVKTTPFHRAATTGNGKILIHMFSDGEALATRLGQSRAESIQVLQLRDPDPISNSIALKLAVKAEKIEKPEAKGQAIGALKALLSFSPDVAYPSDGEFRIRS
jgi:hypothetical protein